MKEFLQKYFEEFSCKEYGNGILLFTPIMYQGADHTFSFYIEQNERGSFTIGDRGQTLGFMRENFDPTKYAEQIARICERFGIVLKKNEFTGTLASYASNQTMRSLHSFLGAMYMLANVDVL